jgi:hypothetical protein
MQVMSSVFEQNVTIPFEWISGWGESLKGGGQRLDSTLEEHKPHH